MTENPTTSSAAGTSAEPAAITAGSPVWLDLSVPDLDSVKGFYQSLFGWDFQDSGPDFGHYHMIMNGDAPVGGAMSQMDSDAGQPATWNVYLKSDDIAQSLTDTAAAGGSVMVPAMPVGDLGQMGVVVTPGGEVLGVWQNGSFDGFALNRALGAPVWFEVMSFDFDADAEYYRTVWGWNLTPLGEDGSESGAAADSFEAGGDGEGVGMRYANNHPGDDASAGLCSAEPSWFPEGTPSYWRAYFAVENADAAAELIREQGGTVLDGPMDTPFGRLATVADPAGASFQIAELPTE